MSDEEYLPEYYPLISVKRFVEESERKIARGPEARKEIEDGKEPTMEITFGPGWFRWALVYRRWPGLSEHDWLAPHEGGELNDT